MALSEPEGGVTRREGRRRSRSGLAAILLGFAVLSVWIALLVPPGKPPDEPAHLRFVNRIAVTGQWRWDVRLQPKGSEEHQPPLYYLIAAQVWKLSGGRILPVRLLATIFGLVTIALTAWLGREVFPELPGVALAAAGMVAFLPMNVYLSSACNNDGLAQMLTTAGVVLLLRATRTGMTLGWALGLGLVCGLAMMAKSTSMCLFVGAAAAIAFLPAPGRSRLGWLAALTAGTLAVAGPWLAGNLMLYGDPLAGRAIVSMSPTYSPLYFTHPWHERVWRAFAPKYLWLSFWGVFNSMASLRDFLPGWVYGGFTLWLLLALGGLWRGANQLWRAPQARVFGTAFLGGGLTLVAGYIALNLMVYQAQGRYFFALLGPLALVLCAGLYTLGGKRWGTWLVWGFVGCLLVAALHAATGAML